ncbi:hypothetical protein [Microtetraspora sp. NBRC 16547]|uniref:hypothetical protein n=1 Tax=Microtetraspora sp. NBRC 16547 TaxID=3030993 RepID=UPI0024A27742|nr:hypothetical protein [Microtetraspora sp. NBRC 16547]GLW98422.1 hypothetical protein Misp02_25090 [Microtetraspora sp. NBRC 16547]
MATYTESEEEPAATMWMRIRSRFTGQAKLTKETLQAVEEARSASAAAREASERAAEAAAETQAAILNYLNGAAVEAKEEPRGTPEEELGKLFRTYLQRGRWRNISITKMLTDLDNEASKLHRGALLAVDTVLLADRGERDVITAGPMKVLMGWKKRAHELEDDQPCA